MNKDTIIEADIIKSLDILKSLGYRFTRPLEQKRSYVSENKNRNMLRAVILDTETTGTDHLKDKIIELGMVSFDYCPHNGDIGDVHQTFNQLESPGFPIPAESTKIHHITDGMVEGKRINDNEVESFIETASIVIAHNSKFDRKFVEKRFPIFETKPWGCTFSQIDWAAEGIGSSKLEFLAYRTGFHFEGHRTSIDCHALLEVLHCITTESGESPLKILLNQARRVEYKISALNAPFESKDILKSRAYRWNAERKVWQTYVQEADFEMEAEWLKAEVYLNKKCKIEREKIDAFIRFSERAGTVELIEI